MSDEPKPKLTKQVREYFAALGRRGGKVKVKKGINLLPEEERKKIRHAAILKGWATKKARKNPGLTNQPG